VGAFLIGSDAVHPLKPVLAMGEGVAGYLAGFHRRLRLEVPASSVKRAVDGLKVKGEPKYDAEGYLLSALGAAVAEGQVQYCLSCVMEWKNWWQLGMSINCTDVACVFLFLCFKNEELHRLADEPHNSSDWLNIQSRSKGSWSQKKLNSGAN
jgi:hypothetical protein